MAQIIVVEGIHDEMRIKSIYKDAYVITTNGREISEDTITMIKNLSINNEIILMLDPDSPGEKIRSLLTSYVPNASQAFLPKKRCISKNKRKVGIEHASNEDIIASLESIYRPTKNTNDITINDMYRLKLIGNTNSSLLRENVSAKLNIGKPNAKTFLRRLNMFNISLKQLEEIINSYE